MKNNFCLVLSVLFLLTACDRSGVHPLLAKPVDCGKYRVTFSASQMTSTKQVNGISTASYTSRYVLYPDPPEHSNRYLLRLDLDTGAAVVPLAGGVMPKQIFVVGRGTGGIEFRTDTGVDIPCRYATAL